MKTITKQWLDFARTDLCSCENNMHDDFVTNIVAFHSQQAVEKALKALLEEKEIKLPRIHSLTRLYSPVSHFFNNLEYRKTNNRTGTRGERESGIREISSKTFSF